MPRKIEYISLQVIEGKQLPAVDPIRRTANPFCSIYINNTKQASTQTVYNTTQPLWNEKIFLESLFPVVASFISACLDQIILAIFLPSRCAILKFGVRVPFL